jgi:hypothetical protein
LHSTKWSDGKKKGGNPTLQKKKKKFNTILIVNEENGYPVPDSN